MFRVLPQSPHPLENGISRLAVGEGTPPWLRLFMGFHFSLFFFFFFGFADFILFSDTLVSVVTCSGRMYALSCGFGLPLLHSAHPPPPPGR